MNIITSKGYVTPKEPEISWAMGGVEVSEAQILPNPVK